ncbi:MAG: Hpt domain-containing protein [Candidatus Binataceae bacterium]
MPFKRCRNVRHNGARGESMPLPIDTRAIEELLSFGGPADPDFCAGIVRRFVCDTEERVAAMGAALSRADREALGAASHALRGAAVQFGAGGIARICAEIERTADAGAIAAIAPMLKRLAAETARVREAIDGRAAHGSGA